MSSAFRSLSRTPNKPHNLTSIIRAIQFKASTPILHSSKTLEKFGLFPKLPPEVRDQIFEDALPAGFHKYKLIIEFIQRFRGGRIVQFESQLTWKMNELALLRVCRESRRVFLRTFKYILPPKSTYPQGGLIRFSDNALFEFRHGEVDMAYKNFSELDRANSPETRKLFHHIKHIRLGTPEVFLAAAQSLQASHPAQGITILASTLFHKLETIEVVRETKAQCSDRIAQQIQSEIDGFQPSTGTGKAKCCICNIPKLSFLVEDC